MALRPVTQGCYNRKGWATNATARTLTSGFIAEPGWTQLQGNVQNGPIIHPNPIDDALELLRGDPNDLKLKVRIGRAGGGDHPAWLRTLVGDFHMEDPRDTFNWPNGVDVVCWWKDDYIEAYTVLMEKLALEYEDEVLFPELLEFTMSLGRTFYMEPFIRQISATAKNPDGTTYWINADAILNAGYTPALDNSSRLAGIEAHAAFAQIRMSIAISPNQYYDPVDKKGKGELFNNSSFSVIAGRHARKVLGRRAVLGNNAYTAPLKTPTALYTYLEDMGAPMYYQTENPNRIWPHLKDTRVQSMNSSRNNMIELPGTYPYASVIQPPNPGAGSKDPADTLTDTEVSTWDADLVSNVTETTPSAPTSFTATVASSTQVDFTWVYPAEGVGIIEIRIYQNGTLKKTVQTYPNDKKLATSVTGLVAGTTSTWLARAYNGVEGPDSNTQTKTTSGTPTGDTTPPNAAVITSATENADGHVVIAWNAATDNSGTITRYDIERDGTVIGSTTTALTFTDSAPVRGATHVYRVRAFDPSDLNTASAAVSVVISGVPTTPPIATGWRCGRKPWK